MRSVQSSNFENIGKRMIARWRKPWNAVQETVRSSNKGLVPRTRAVSPRRMKPRDAYLFHCPKKFSNSGPFNGSIEDGLCRTYVGHEKRPYEHEMWVPQCIVVPSYKYYTTVNKVANYNSKNGSKTQTNAHRFSVSSISRLMP